MVMEKNLEKWKYNWLSYHNTEKKKSKYYCEVFLILKQPEILLFSDSRYLTWGKKILKFGTFLCLIPMPFKGNVIYSCIGIRTRGDFIWVKLAFI